MANPLKMIFGSRNDRVLRRIKKTVKKINALEEDMQALDNDALRAKTQEIRDRYQAGESLDDLLPEALWHEARCSASSDGLLRVACRLPSPT